MTPGHFVPRPGPDRVNEYCPFMFVTTRMKIYFTIHILFTRFYLQASIYKIIFTRFFLHNSIYKIFEKTEEDTTKTKKVI